MGEEGASCSSFVESIAAVNSVAGKPIFVHGLDLQQPRNGGEVF